MNFKKNKENKSRPINLVLLAVSFVIFGSLGTIFITQMELQPGWAWEKLRESYPIETYIQETEDINGNGIRDLIGYADLRGYSEEERIETRDYGGIFCFESSTGYKIWEREYNEAVKGVFPIMDINGDNIKDYFICKASVTPDWNEKIKNDEGKETIEYEPKYPLNSYDNKLIYGNNGSDINEISFTNFYVHDVISLDVIPDSEEDLILLEAEEFETFNGNESLLEYRWRITTYYINGTMKDIINNTSYAYPHSKDSLPHLELFHYNDQSHLLFISPESIILLNLSSSNFFEPIYEIPFLNSIDSYEIIEDLDADGILEIIVTFKIGSVFLINGFSGGIIKQFVIPENSEVIIEELHNDVNDGETYVFFNIKYFYENSNLRERFWQIYSISLSSQELIWEKHHEPDNKEIEENVFILHDDIDSDSVDDIILFKQLRNPLSAGDVNRFTISNLDGSVYAVLNLDASAERIITIDDIDNDGIKDFAFSKDGRFVAISSNKPEGLWLSKEFPLGFPLFIILTALVCIGLVIILLKAKRLKYRRQNIKEHKLTIVVNSLAIVLMTITFLLFLVFLNIFNATLIPNSNNTAIITVFLTVCIIWYGTLPLTAALYNRFAPHFALLFIKLRTLFFKISKAYKTDIIILDMKGRRDIGVMIQLKRLILPLLLSIAVGFYAYDILTSNLGYPTEFGVFGSSEFFKFMVGYMLCCVLPIIISFAIFSFLVSGNYLLDDAGVVYYREHKTYRQPGDIEPISIWAQS
ncbi:MAG: hypothetical protein ACFFCE_14505, partial [Promethearchaeota archaeon]